MRELLFISGNKLFSFLCVDSVTVTTDTNKCAYNVKHFYAAV